jgi:hypothetical protein
MIWWLVDHGANVVLLLAIVAVILIVVWWTNRNPKVLIALASIAVLMLLTWLLSFLVVTDRMRLADTVQHMAQSVREKHVDRLFDKISTNFRWNNMDKAQFRDFVKSRIERVSDFRVHKISFPGVVDRAQKKGEVQFWVQVTGMPQAEDLPIRCEADFTFESDQWKLKGFKVFLGGSPNELHPSGQW